MSELPGRVALITGGATGLGAAIATMLARLGVVVAINYRSSERGARDLTDRLRADGHSAEPFGADVAGWDEAHTLVERVAGTLGPVDILVNNAGVTRAIPAKRVDMVSLADWDAVLDVNLVGTFACIQASLPSMTERGFGRILNVASDSAFTSSGSSIPYVVSKAGVVSLTRALADAVAVGITVNAVAPGWIATPWLDRYLAPAERDALRAGPILTPARVAAAAVDLLSDRDANGVVLRIDVGTDPSGPDRVVETRS